MVRRSKKALCLILAIIIICAESALCALGTFADSFIVSTYYCGRNTNAAGSSLPISYSVSNHPESNNISQFTVAFNSNSPFLTIDSTYYVTFEFTLALNIDLDSNDYIKNIGSGFYSDYYTRDCSNVVYQTVSVGVTGTHYLVSFELTPSRLQYNGSQLSFCITSSSTIPLQRGFICSFDSFSISDEAPALPTWEHVSGQSTYYSCIKNVSGDVYKGSNYTWQSSVTGFTELPSIRFRYKNKGLFLSFCQDVNLSTYLVANTVINGECDIMVTRPDVTRGYPITSAEVWLTNGTNPSDSNFQYLVIDESYGLTDALYYNDKHPYYYGTYQFVFTLPSNFSGSYSHIMIYFSGQSRYLDSSGNETFLVLNPAGQNDSFYQFTKYELYYLARSSGNVDVPPEPVIEPDIESAEEQNVEYALNEEKRKVLEDYDNSQVSEAASIFSIAGFASAFGTLYTALNNQGTSFNFYLESTGNVPFLNATLWDRQEIPIKYYIDSLPSTILVIFRLIVWITTAVVTILAIKSLVKALQGRSDL